MIEIKREKYLKRIRPFYDSEYIKVITGIRRCGKSVLMKQIIDEIKDKGVDDNHIIVLNLEGKSGVLNMDSDASITFKNDVKEDEVSESTESAESEETIETEQVLESG